MKKQFTGYPDFFYTFQEEYYKKLYEENQWAGHIVSIPFRRSIIRSCMRRINGLVI